MLWIGCQPRVSRYDVNLIFHINLLFPKLVASQ